MIRKTLFLLIFLQIILTGCKSVDYIEPENRQVVTSVIIDCGEEGYSATIETASVGIKGEDNKYKPEYISGSGKNFSETIDNIQNSVTKELSFYHCPLVICSKECYDSFATDFLNYFINNEEFSLAAYLLVTENTKSLLEILEESDVFIGYEVTDLVELKGVKCEIIDILRGRALPPNLLINDNKEYTLSENING